MKNFFNTIFKSLNPDSYRELAPRSWNQAIQYFLSALFLAFIVMMAISLPSIARMPYDISSKLNDFEQLQVDLKIKTTQPIYYPEKNPFIIVDTTGNNTELNNSEAKFLVTGSFISKKKNICFWADPLCFLSRDKYEEFKFKEYGNVLSKSEEYGKLFTRLFIFALPTIFFMLYIIFAIKYLILALIASQIIFIFARWLKISIMWRYSFRIAIYATTILMILEIALSPLFNIGYWSLLIYLFIAVAGSYFSSGQQVVVSDN